MSKYVDQVIANVKEKHGNEPEFVQTVEEVLSSLAPVIDQHPEYEKVDLLGRMVEPERMFTFRVVWEDDNGNIHTNIGYRCQRSDRTKAAFVSSRTSIRESSSSSALSRFSRMP